MGSKADKGHHPKMKNRKKMKVIVEKNDTGFSAYAVDYPVFTTGDTMNKLIDNINEAFSLFSEPEKYDIHSCPLNWTLNSSFNIIK